MRSSFPAAFQRLPGILVILLVVGGAYPVAAQLQYSDLHRCRLENGAVIQDCHLAYRTFGTLNRDASNAVLFPSWFSGTSGDLVSYVQPGGLIDSTQYFVILIDAFGNGVSSSPSTSRKQSGALFPRFTIRDMVQAQKRLVENEFGLDKLDAVIGISMGGMQAFEWIVQYPEWVQKAVSIVGSPRLTPYDRLLWSAQKSAIETAAHPEEGMKTVGLIHALNLQTPAKVAQMSEEEFAEFKQGVVEGARTFEPADWKSQLEAMLEHNIYEPFGGTVGSVSDVVQAEVLVATSRNDHMVHPQPATRFAETLDTDYLELTGNCGHLAFGCQQEKLVERVRKFLGQP